MRTKLMAFLIILIGLFNSCKDSKTESGLKNKEENTIEFSKTFLESKDLVLSKDTLKKTINFKYRNYEIPLKVALLSGMDKEFCNRVVYFKIKEDDKSAGKVKISSISAQLIPCAMEFNNGETKDTTRFETAVINIELHVQEGIKKYEYKGSMGQITSLGEYKNY